MEPSNSVSMYLHQFREGVYSDFFSVEPKQYTRLTANHDVHGLVLKPPYHEEASCTQYAHGFSFSFNQPNTFKMLKNKFIFKLLSGVSVDSEVID